MAASEIDYGIAARRLIRGCGHAALATSLDGRPYVSLVAVACALDATPLLLLSDLAQHTRNIAADPRVSLLVSGAGALPDPLAGPRLSLVGRAEPAADAAARARFVARHPSAAAYGGFADFRLYRVIAERGHLVAGFGRIAWVDGAALRIEADLAAFIAAEAGMLAQVNADPALVALCAERLLGRPGRGWRVAGIDPDGIDMRCDDAAGRLDFAAPAADPAAASAAVAALAAAARAAPSA